MLYGQKPSTVSLQHAGSGHHQHGGPVVSGAASGQPSSSAEKSSGHEKSSSKEGKEGGIRRKDTIKEGKLKHFLKRSSEPILNGLPFNAQQVRGLPPCIAHSRSHLGHAMFSGEGVQWGFTRVSVPRLVFAHIALFLKVSQGFSQHHLSIIWLCFFSPVLLLAANADPFHNDH